MTYTLILTDPDATSRADPTKAEMCHWIATNISLVSINATQTDDTQWEVNTGEMPGVDALIEYLAPSPPPKTGKHRYVFAVLAPKPENAVVAEGGSLKKPKDRAHWGYGKVGKGVRDWAAENDLVVVGERPLRTKKYRILIQTIGAHFFYTQNDEQ